MKHAWERWCAVSTALQHGYMRASDGVEYALSRWWGWFAYAATLAASYVWWGWDTIDRWVYISNALLVVLLIRNQRASDRAMHIKLDAIDEVEEHNELEKRDEIEMKP